MLASPILAWTKDTGCENRTYNFTVKFFKLELVWQAEKRGDFQ
jgi:hypothetical protein